MRFKGSRPAHGRWRRARTLDTVGHVHVAEWYGCGESAEALSLRRTERLEQNLNVAIDRKWDSPVPSVGRLLADSVIRTGRKRHLIGAHQVGDQVTRLAFIQRLEQTVRH